MSGCIQRIREYLRKRKEDAEIEYRKSRVRFSDYLVYMPALDRMFYDPVENPSRRPTKSEQEYDQLGLEESKKRDL